MKRPALSFSLIELWNSPIVCFWTESHREWQNWTRYQRARASGAGRHQGARWDMRLRGRSKWLDSVPV